MSVGRLFRRSARGPLFRLRFEGTAEVRAAHVEAAMDKLVDVMPNQFVDECLVWEEGKPRPPVAS